MIGRAAAQQGTVRTREQIAARIAQDLKPGYCVNLGIGIPLLVADALPADTDVVIHAENGILGMGPAATPEFADPDLVNAGKVSTTLVEGSSIFDSSVSFAMIRRGRLDVAVLGALEVSGSGDLANWIVPGGIPGVGGAMDLAHGSREVWVAMDHVSRSGAPKIVEACSYPLTAARCVDRIYTSMAGFVIRDHQLVLVEVASGFTVDDVARCTAAAFEVELS